MQVEDKVASKFLLGDSGGCSTLFTEWLLYSGSLPEAEFSSESLGGEREKITFPILLVCTYFQLKVACTAAGHILRD